ncbi:MAG: hypothetical protein ACI8XZ_002663 [Gammaproteobacteria bacterium]|jgi:hypothetical protein
MKMGRMIRSTLRSYLIVCGIGVNLLLLVVAACVVQEGPTWISFQLVEISNRARSRSEFASDILSRAARIIQPTAAPDTSDPIEDLSHFALTPPVTPNGFGYGQILSVGPAEDFLRVSDAAKAVRDGDIIEIAPGVYPYETSIWLANDVLIRGRGGIAILDASDTPLAQEKAIWVIQGDNYRIENVGFINAVSIDNNGAGIRSEGANLHISHCFFRDNETALLSSQNPESTITIEHSELARNGHLNGQAHQVYIGAVKSAIFRFNYIHHARTGSSIKSRALSTTVAYNRILDGVAGTGNYSLDFSEGGRAVVFGNTIQQSRYTNNEHLVAFAPESQKRTGNLLIVAHNTMVNDRSDGVFIRQWASELAYVYNNIFIGHGTTVEGNAVMAGNVHADYNSWYFWHSEEMAGIDASFDNIYSRDAGIVSRENFNYELVSTSKAVDAGVELDAIDGYPLAPEFEYMHPITKKSRLMNGTVDAGAYEYQAPH